MNLKIDKFPHLLIDPSTLECEEFISCKKYIVLDIGCGEGEFILDLATNNPRKTFIGLEIKYGRIVKCLKKTKSNGLSNIRFILGDASILVNEVLPKDSLNKVFINNPDPWPKDKHRNNRIINSLLLNSLFLSIKRKGCLYIKTDSKEYYKEIKNQLKETKFRFELDNSLFDKSLPSTKFQEFYKKNKKKIFSIKLTKR